MSEALENVMAQGHEEVVQPQDTEVSESPASEDAKEDSSKEYNFKQLRESKRQLESELEQLREQVSQLASSRKEDTRKEEDFDLGDDDLAEGRHVKKLYSRIESMIRERDAMLIENRLRSKYSDFEQVVTRENVEKLKKSEPEIYASISSSNDLYSASVSAYKTLKALGIVEDPDMAREKEKIQKNTAKPVSSHALKGGSIHEANAFAGKLTPELKKQLLNEMVEAAKAR